MLDNRCPASIQPMDAVIEALRARHSATLTRLLELPLEVEGYRLERLEQPVSSGWVRPTTVVVLRGRGQEGRGEDVTYDAADHERLHETPPFPLGGSFTLAGFSVLLSTLSLMPAEPVRPTSRFYRRWAFESAALDLALRQASLSLGEALDRPYRPVRFVVSTRLDARRWLALDPTLELKLDPTPEWTDELMQELAASGRVRVLDLKGHHVGSSVQQPPDPALYARLVERFPDAIIEDAALTPQTRRALRGAEDRLSWDAPIHSLADVDALPLPPRFLNIKPSRFGTMRALLECLEACERRGIRLYGGGHFELGLGRGQIQALASLFYPDAPNDVAPPGYNEPEPRAGLPPSPLAPPLQPVGFSW
jgi:hypothetical protein